MLLDKKGNEKVEVMAIIFFLLLMIICVGMVYFVHKFFGKEQFYLLGIIYSIVSFIMSFKLINIMGVNINANVIFSSGLLLILYYFVKRYNAKESKKFIFTVIVSNLFCIFYFLLSSFMVPSIYDKMSVFYKNMIFDNLAIVILYPVSLAVTLFLSEYCFRELNKEDENNTIKMILTILGIMFIDNAIFIYFSYAFIIRFDTAIGIAIDNYLIKTAIMIIYTFIANKLFKVKKVK